MIEFEQKKKLQKYLYSKTVLVVLCLMLVGIVNATFNVYQKHRLSSMNLDIATKEFDKLKDRHLTLASQIDRLHTEQGTEEEIRQKYRVVKEGEEIAVIVDENKKKQATASTTPEGFWQKLKKIFTSD